MSESRQQIKRTSILSSQMQRTDRQQLNTGVGSNPQNLNISATGYQGQTTFTSSRVISSKGDVLQESYGSIQRSKQRGEFELPQSQDKFVVNGQTDFVALKNMKGAMLELINQFRARGNLDFQGEYRQNFQKRLILLEKQLDGLVRRSAYRVNGSQSRKDTNMTLQRSTANFQQRINQLQRSLQATQTQLDQLNQLNNGLKEEVKSKVSYIQELSRLLQKGMGYNSSQGQGDSTQGYLASLEAQLQALKPKKPNLQNLQATVQGWILGLPLGSYLQKKLQIATLRMKQDDLYKAMVQKLKYAQNMFQHQLAEIQRLNPSFNLPSKSKILDMLAAPNTNIQINVTGVVEVQTKVYIEKEVGVPDARLKALITSLAKLLKKLLLKYPKLKQEIDVQIQEYLSLEIIDQILEGDIDRIVSITRYIPQVIKVQNVYTHHHEKNRKVQFYLRVLIKALLQELERVKLLHNLNIELDEGIFGMIQAQILQFEFEEIDAIINMFRPIPKIVQVPKYIQKVIDNVITIPEKYVVKQSRTDIFPLNKTEVVHDQVGVAFRQQFPVQLTKQVPVKTTDYIEKPVIYTQYRQVPVNQVIEKTKAMEVPTKVEVIVEKDRPIQIPGQERIVIQKELQIRQIQKNDVRYIETVQEVIKPVEVIVEKVVEKMIERERAVAVPVIQEKLVKQTVYQIIKENNPILVTKYEVVPETHEKIVEFIRDRDRIVEVPQVFEKIVTVQKVVELPPKMVQVKQQVMVPQKEIQIIEIPKVEVVIQNEQVPVQVVEHHDRPLFVEVVKVEKQISNVPMMNQIVKQIHIPVEISKPCIITQQVPVEVTSSYPQFIKQEVPVFVKEQETVPIPFYYDRIKTEIQTVEKIIEKIVEVPKCVQVEKIVEKIIIVPRIVQKIVQVPQIIERIVEKIVQVPKEMPPIERIIERPCIRQVPVEVPVERIVYLTVEKQKIVVEEVMVKDTETRTTEVPHEIINQRVVVQTKEKPVDVFRDRVQYMYVDNIKIVKTDNVIVHPVEIPVPIILEKDLPIPIVYETVNVLPVPQKYEVIVPQVQQVIRVEKVDVVHKIPYIQDQVQIVDRDRVIVQTRYEEVKVIEEKIVEVQNIIEQIKEVPVIFEQIVPVVKEVAKVYQFDKDPKIIETPAKIEIIQKVKPYIVNVNKYIERIVQKLVQVPYLIKQTNVKDLVRDRIVPGAERFTKETEVMQLTVEKQILREVEKKVIDTVVRIDQVLKCATEIIERDRDPVIITKDRIIEVPHVLQKIVEKIVIMPQVLEVLKHVVQVIEEDNINVLVDLDVEVKQYKDITVNLQQEMIPFLEQLKRVKTSQPHLAGRIDAIERYFHELKRFIKHPRLIEKIKEVKSDPVRQVVRLPHEKTAEQAKDDLAKVLLIQQLLAGLRKIGAENKNINLENYIEKEIMMMFDINFNASVKKVNESFNSQLKKFQNSIQSKFSKLNGWGTDHNIMLKSFIDERFQLANVIKKTKELNAQLSNENNQLREKLERERDVPVRIIELLIEFNQFMPRILGVLDKDKHKELYESYNKLLKKFENFKRLYDSSIGDSRVYISSQRTIQLDDDFMDKYKASCLREFVRQMDILKEKVRNSNWRENEHSACQATIEKLKAEIVRLEALLRNANSKIYEIEHRELDYQSPKRSDNTHISHGYKRDESRYVPGSQSDVEAYGQNFGEYVVSDPTQAGLIQGTKRQAFQNYNSQVEPQQFRDLSGSAATYRSNQVITSAHNIRVQNTDNLSIESSKKNIEGGNVVSYGSNVGYGSSHNLISSQYQTLGTGGTGSSTYGNNVKITTSRITANDGVTGTRLEGSYSGREGGRETGRETGREVPTTTRKYQFHEKKYENGREA